MMMNASKKESSPGTNLESGNVSENSVKGHQVPHSTKEMSEAEFDTFIDDIMQLFRELEDLSDLRTLYETGKALSQAYFNCIPYRPRVAQHLIDHSYPDYATKMLKKLNNLGVFKNDDIWFSSFYFYNTCWNYSDVSAAFASALASAGLPSLLKLNIAHKPYLDNMQSRNVTYLLKATVSIIHNIVRDPPNTHYFNEKSVKESLANLLTNENEMIHGLALSCLAYLVNEEETAMLERGSSSIKYLVEWLDYALHKSGEKRRCRGFTPEEIASALGAIAVNDTLKTTIDQEGALPHLVEMANGARPGEVGAALKALWNLAFDEAVLARLLANFDLEGLVQRLQSHEDESVRKTATSLSWMITKRREAPSPEPEPGPGGGEAKPFVFISYSWVDQALVLKIRDRLREEGIEYWLDLEHIHQSTLDAMARGIEQSGAVLVCASEAYKRSANCRLEATYAQRLRRSLVPALMQSRYKPDGYLGILMSDNLYFDFGKKPFEQAVAGLVRELRRLLGQSGGGGGDAVDAGAAAMGKGSGGAQEATAAPGPRLNGEVVAPDRVHEVGAGAGTGPHRVRGWRPDDVALWLDRCALGHVKLSMCQIDGELLLQMVQLRRESPDFFYKSLDRKLGMTFVDILKFVAALDKLSL